MTNMLAMRLLELEEKFDSYCAIHKQELAEFKILLDQLREDILNSDKNESTDFSLRHVERDSSLNSIKNSDRKE